MMLKTRVADLEFIKGLSNKNFQKQIVKRLIFWYNNKEPKSSLGKENFFILGVD